MNKSIISAVVIMLALSAWMLSGSGGKADASLQPAITAVAKKNKPLMKVTSRLSTAVELEQFVTVKGQVEPLRSVTIKAETQGRVVELPVNKGERVVGGQLLARLALNDRGARLTEANTMVGQKERDLASTSKLVKKQLKAANQLKADEANLAAAKARLEQIRWEISNTAIKAPFSGVLNERQVELGAFLQEGEPVGVLVDDATLLLTAQASQLAVQQLRTGQQVSAELINGVVLQGVLNYVSAIARQGTRSYRIEARVANTELKAYTGLSATITLPIGKTLAHKVPHSALGLDAQGRLIVKGVGEQGVVVVQPVTLIRRERDGMWVDGLPQTFNLIILGQEYLAAGEKVSAQPEAGS